MNKYLAAGLARLIYKKEKRKHSTGNIHGTPQNILVIRADALGDMVCTTPFLRELRRNVPRAFITLVCNPGVYNLVELCPYVDEILTYKPASGFFRVLRETRAFADKHFRGRDYDLAIYLPYGAPEYFAAWLAFFSGAKKRLAYAERVSNSKKRAYIGAKDIYYTDLLHNDDRAIRHEAACALHFLTYLQMSVQDDSYEIWTDEADERRVDELFAEEKIDVQARNIVVNLSTSEKSKDWPVEDYVQVCRELSRKYEISFILIGAGVTAEQYSREFCREIPEAHDLTGQTTIRQTYLVLKRSGIYLGGDTGPLHLAAAAECNGAGIYASPKDYLDPPGNPSIWFAPLHCGIKVVQPEHLLPGCKKKCHRDYPHCIKQIDADEVLNALEGILGNA